MGHTYKRIPYDFYFECSCATICQIFSTVPLSHIDSDSILCDRRFICAGQSRQPHAMWYTALPIRLHCFSWALTLKEWSLSMRGQIYYSVIQWVQHTHTHTYTHLTHEWHFHKPCEHTMLYKGGEGEQYPADMHVLRWVKHWTTTRFITLTINSSLCKYFYQNHLRVFPLTRYRNKSVFVCVL